MKPLDDVGIVHKFFRADLYRMQIQDIELIRSWRNQSHIRENLVFKGIVKRCQQTDWFAKERHKNAHYVCAVDEIPFGLFSLRDIKEDGSAESGGFIGDSRYLGSIHSFASSYGLNEIFFTEMGGRSLSTTVYANNKAAIRYNLFLGYRLIKEDDDGLQHYSLSYEDYLPAKQKVERMLGG